MIRKLFFFAAFLLTLGAVSAQSVGEWNIFTRFAGKIDKVVDTPERVYFSSGNRLFSFDKEANETYAYTTQNRLNDTNVSLIEYNPEGKYLFIGYDNGNIDLLYDNDRLINMSDIKDATLTYNKDINSVTFGKERIYVATAFGIVVFNDSRHEVTESGIFGVPVETVMALGDNLVLFMSKDGKKLYSAPLDGHHNTLSKFTPFADVNCVWMRPLGENSVIFNNLATGNNVTVAPIVKNGNTLSLGDLVPLNVTSASGAPVHTAVGDIFNSANTLFFLDGNGTVTQKVTIPEPLRSQQLATAVGPKSIWGADADGVANYDITDGSLTVLSDKYKPEGIVTENVFFQRYDREGSLWLGNLGVSQYKFGNPDDFFWFVQETTRIRDGKPQDMSVFNDTTAKDGTTKSQQTAKNSTRMYGGCVSFAVDPENCNRYFQGNNLEGVYVIENNEVVHRFDWDNAPFKGYGWRGVKVVEFDPDGNLWVGYWTQFWDQPPYYVLPKEVLRGKELKDIQKTDWRPAVKMQGVDRGNKDMTMLFCKQSNVLITFHGADGAGFGFTHTNGTWGNPEDDVYGEIGKTVDQDGKEWAPTHIVSAIEDKRGRVWLGTNAGIVEISDPKSLTETSTITRLKVPRNDGTNYADYLCESDLIYDMAVDSSNRKWIATETSGVYLVSENGDKILEHFTTENSPLPDNRVISVSCDPNSNTVYFGLMSGLVSYKAASAPGAQDYSGVYAYPNPVRPEYTGYITITGLMDNSLVKITDAQGNLVHQTKSEGGMAIWDGMDASHNPAKSGVYYVFASQDPSGSTTSAVTKIMIVR